MFKAVASGVSSLWAVFVSLVAASSLRTLFLGASGLVTTLVAMWFAETVRDQSWPLSLRPEQLWYLGTALLMSLGINGIVIIAIAAVKFSGKGPGGLSVEVNSGDQPSPPPVVRTVTETSVEPQAIKPAKGKKS